MLNRLKLGPKFTLLLLLVFILGSSLGGMVLSNVLEQRAEAQIVSEGLALMQTINAVRDYTNTRVRPLLEQEDGSTFVPEEVPSFAAVQVFETLRQQKEYHKLVYKEAVINPTNPKDLADPFELTLVDDFVRSPQTPEISGFRHFPGKGLTFFSARPLAVRDPSCLRCHSTPEVAPPAMLAMYGSENGFGWELDSVIGTQIIYLPASEVMATAQRAFSSIIGIFIAVFLVAVLLINWLLKPTVLTPLQYLARLSQKLGAGDMEPVPGAVGLPENQRLEQVAHRRDELGQLAKVFQAMVRDVIAREEQLMQQIKNLRIEIDQSKRAREVAEITDNDEFKALQEKARKYRQRSRPDSTEDPPTPA